MCKINCFFLFKLFAFQVQNDRFTDKVSHVTRETCLRVKEESFELQTKNNELTNIQTKIKKSSHCKK